jgi:hypothetical protein
MAPSRGSWQHAPSLLANRCGAAKPHLL